MPLSFSRPTVRSAALFGLLLLGAEGARPSWTQPLGPEPLRPPPAASYTVTDLGTVPGGDLSAALALNATGQVTGYAVSVSGPHAFLWTRGDGMLDLGTLPGDSRSYGTGVNAAGVVCGISQGSGSHAFVWSEIGGLRALVPLATGTETWAYGINTAGQVAGMSSYIGPAGRRCFGAVVWDASGSIQRLPVPDPTLANTTAVATAINDAGQATGYQEIADLGASRSQPFVWDAAHGLKLLARPAGTSGRPLANNVSGRVLGLSAGANASFPVSWTPAGDGTILDSVNPLSGAGPFQQELGGINAAGEIVYSLSTKTGGAAVRFRAGSAVDLNGLVGAGAAYRLTTAAAVNDSGQIVGALVSNDGSRSRAYLLTPKSAGAVSVSAVITPVNLGTAAKFAILSKTGISTTGVTRVVGPIGVSPIAASAITGFGLTMDSSGQFSRSPSVTGEVYAANYAAPTPTMLTTAVGDMAIAYTDAAGRTNPTATELGAGNIGGKVIAPGLYKWSSSVLIPANVTLSGPADGVWIFQIAGSLNVSSGAQVILSGGAQAKNIFWQVADQTTLETTSVFNGNILDKTAIVVKNGATINGRALAQTAVTLDANAITRPTVSPSAPIDLSVSPSSSTSNVGAPRLFTTRYSDADGAGDFQYVQFLVNSSPTGGRSLLCRYDAVANKLFLLNDSGSAFMGGFAPGSAQVIQDPNGRGSLDCARTTVSRSGNILQVVWSLTPAANFAGPRKLYLNCADKTGLKDGWDELGSWSISGAPVNTSVSPASGSSSVGTARTLTAVYTDPNGSADIVDVRLLVNNQVGTAGGLLAFYDPRGNKLYLRNAADTSWMGGFAPGSAQVIREANGRGSLNCALTQVTRSANGLTVAWSLTPTATFTGAKNVYLYCKDTPGFTDGFEMMGTWTITP